MIWIKINPGVSDSIDETAREAIALGNRLGVGIRFSFNEIWCPVYPSSTVAEIVGHYHRESKRIDSTWRHIYAVDDRLAAIERRLDAADSHAGERD